MNKINVPPIAPEEIIPFMNVDQTDFSDFTHAELIRHIEVEGYAILPKILDDALITKLKSELAGAEMIHLTSTVFA
ncbi:MAG: hypothetical protein OXI66_05610 [Boseongicola sp.]|nr:hypothetical protein [Boseongicola sp.]